MVRSMVAGFVLLGQLCFFGNSTVLAETVISPVLQLLLLGEELDVDNDGDGYTENQGDCNDANSAISPGRSEICGDGIDQDCNGSDTLCQQVTNSLGMTFELIAAGSFTMGSPDGSAEYPVGSGLYPAAELGRADADVETPHQVTITQQFYMQTTEVTQGQWKAVMSNDNPSYYDTCGDNCPVEQVSWDEVQTFITTLNTLGQGTYRLPFEAEWEYAARAGSTTAFFNGAISNIYIDANLAAVGWYWDNSGAEPQIVGQKDDNGWGLFDMHGNVHEWVQDWYGDYSSGAEEDPEGPVAGTGRVRRGGSYLSTAQYCRAASRGSYSPSSRSNSIGFRLVREP